MLRVTRVRFCRRKCRSLNFDCHQLRRLQCTAVWKSLRRFPANRAINGTFTEGNLTITIRSELSILPARLSLTFFSDWFSCSLAWVTAICKHKSRRIGARGDQLYRWHGMVNTERGGGQAEGNGGTESIALLTALEDKGHCERKEQGS